MSSPDPDHDPLPPQDDATVSADLEPDQPLVPLPERIGDYRVVGKLGEGGMGVVYEAEQQQPRRRVALKVVRGGKLVSDESARMFRREAETLARLRHPHIAAIYESGRTEDGQNFFAMELVRGAQLDEYLRNRPSIASRDEQRHRLELFRRIADAVHYAHQRGVIHRDLKPSNIVVSGDVSTEDSSSGTRSQEVKILDFGLARVVESDAADTTRATEVGTIKGTLSHMSPEQARGNPDEIDVRTDVYSLGVILYGMLTGKLPYDVQGKPLVEAVRVICEEPPRAFAKLGAAVRHLDGDLETIAGKALEKDVDRRYASAAALSDDVGRYLSSLPIQARPPSALYVLRKLARRNRPLVAGAAAVIAALAIGAVVSTWQAGRATREAAKANAVNDFLHEMFAAASPMSMTKEDPERGREITVHQMLGEASQRLDSGDLTGQPLVEAAVRMTIGATYRDLGDYESAEAHLRRALDIRRKELKPDDPEVAESLDALGEVLHLRGDLDGAEPLFREALAIQQRHSGGGSAAAATTMQNLGDLLQDRGDPEGAEPLLRSALAIRRKVLGPDAVETATTLSTLAIVLRQRGSLEEAEGMLRNALKIQRNVLGNRHPDVARTLNELAVVLSARGNLPGAESALRETVGIWKELLGADHLFVSAALANLGTVLRDEGKLPEAETMLRESLRIVRSHYGGENLQVGTSLYNLARVQQAQGKLADAESNARAALAILRRALPAGHPTIAGVAAGLGSVLVDRNRGAEAEPLLREALGIYDEAAPGRWYSHQVRSVLGAALLEQGRFTEAEPLVLDGWTGLKDDVAVTVGRKRAALERVARLYERWNADRPGAGKASAAAEWSARVDSLTR